MPLIKASELRKKYFNEEIFIDATFEQLKTLCEKSIIFGWYILLILMLKDHLTKGD